MSKPLSSSSLLPVDVETAWRALTGDAFVARCAQEFGDDSRVVRREPAADGGLLFEVSRQLPDGAPSVVERFLPPDGRLTQTDTWDPVVDGVRRGTWQVHGKGVPAEMSGTMALEPVEGGCRHRIEGSVTVKVPLIGGKAESLLVEMTQKLAEREAQLAGEILATG